MTTGYRQAELDNLHKQMTDNAPTIPTAEDRKTSPTATALAWNGSHTGMLLNLEFLADQSMVLHLNCVVALRLMLGINEVAEEHGWWEEKPPGSADGDRPPLFSVEQGDAMLVVSTIVTGPISDGVLIKFGNASEGIFNAFLPRSVARGLAVSIATMGAAADWWGEDLVLKPTPLVDDLVVMRAANQLIQMFGARAEIEAALRSNAAQDEKDLSNYHLWQRVALAIAQLRQTKPSTPNLIN